MLKNQFELLLVAKIENFLVISSYKIILISKRKRFNHL